MIERVLTSGIFRIGIGVEGILRRRLWGWEEVGRGALMEVL